MMYKEVRIDEEVRLNGCIIAERSEVGRSAVLEDSVMVGPDCKIGDHVRILRSSKIWPKVEVGPGSIIDGVVKVV
jgi:NDP-sugar pyrophosphorylase family protein